jgi:hypothetical protein
MSQMGKLSLTKRKQHSRAKTQLGLQSKKVYPLGKDVSPRGSYRPSAVHEIEPSKTGQTNMDGV